MSSELSRRSLLLGLPVSGLAGGVLLGSAKESSSAVPDVFPQQQAGMVREVVAVSHGNFKRVRELVEARSALAKAVWDWGFGDWESALGAASHTGNRDIALYLIEQGARPTLFSATMLGQLKVVQAFIDASPGIQRTAGPHGISLLSHAELGGPPARQVFEYLKELGDAVPDEPSLRLDEAQQAVYLGVFAFGAGPNNRLEVYKSRRGGLMIRRGDGIGRGLSYHGDHTFHPAGAPAVRIRFTLRDQRAIAVQVDDGPVQVSAERAEAG